MLFHFFCWLWWFHFGGSQNHFFRRTQKTTREKWRTWIMKELSQLFLSFVHAVWFTVHYVQFLLSLSRWLHFYHFFLAKPSWPLTITLFSWIICHMNEIIHESQFFNILLFVFWQCLFVLALPLSPLSVPRFSSILSYCVRSTSWWNDERRQRRCYVCAALPTPPPNSENQNSRKKVRSISEREKQGQSSSLYSTTHTNPEWTPQSNRRLVH